MVWNAQNSFFSPNVGAYGAHNVGAGSSYNVGAHGSHNVGAHGSHNVGAHGSHNVGAHGSHNVGAHGSHNVASNVWASGAAAAVPVVVASHNTGAGSASGTGFLGGYGAVARFEYATPAGLAPLPWVMDFTEGDGWPSFPYAVRINPYPVTPNTDGTLKKVMEWQPSDWDPGLRFWSLDFDPQLTEWLQDLNLAAPSVMAAREFARHHKDWLAREDAVAGTDPGPSDIQRAFEGTKDLLTWRARDDDDATTRAAASTVVSRELNEMVDLMRDDRMRYLEELAAQSGAIVPYFVHLMGINPATKPWTMELMNCASAIGNLVKMQYKSHYKRVRASTLCPGLTPPWGPPQHPSFPSGHATVGHLTALLLLSVPGIAQRFGVFDPEKRGAKAAKGTELDTIGRQPALQDFFDLAYGMDQHSPLLWMAWRIARGRERLGVHYASDSAAGRRLAALVWHACTRPAPKKGDVDPIPAIRVPSLQTVLTKARAEWPEL
ncbi:hypothetical protein [Roseateles sp. P5_E7]